MVRKSTSEKVSLPTGITTKKGWFITFEKIHEMFAKTNYGHILKQRIRWSMFKPTEYSDSEWEKVLGPDANNLDHLLLAYRMTKHFLQQEKRFTRKEQEILLFTSIVHDWAEPVVGDIMRYVKTKEDDRREIKLLRNVLYEVLGNAIDKELVEKVCLILKNKESKLGRAFNAVETLGYFETAFRAWDRSHKVNGDLKMRLRWLTSNVLLIDVSKLIHLSQKYLSVKQFIDKNRTILNMAFLHMPTSVFKFHRHNKIDYYERLFIKQRRLWQRYDK